MIDFCRSCLTGRAIVISIEEEFFLFTQQSYLYWTFLGRLSVVIGFCELRESEYLWPQIPIICAQLIQLYYYFVINLFFVDIRWNHMSIPHQIHKYFGGMRHGGGNHQYSYRTTFPVPRAMKIS